MLRKHYEQFIEEHHSSFCVSYQSNAHTHHVNYMCENFMETGITNIVRAQILWTKIVHKTVEVACALRSRRGKQFDRFEDLSAVLHYD